MDFSNRGQVPTQPNTNRFAPTGQQPAVSQEQPKPTKSTRSPDRAGLWIKGVLLVFLVSMVILVAALLLFIAFGNQTHEGSYVNTSEYQAVEVANPGAKTPTYYYGKINSIDKQYLVLNQAFVLTSSASDSTVTVAPLSCVSANSASQLVFNRSQVILWNNLASNSSASEAIQQQANATGSCPSANQSTSPASSTPAPTTTNSTSAGSQSTTQPAQSTTQQTTPSRTSSSTPSNPTTTPTNTNPSAPKTP